MVPKHLVPDYPTVVTEIQCKNCSLLPNCSRILSVPAPPDFRLLQRNSPRIFDRCITANAAHRYLDWYKTACKFQLHWTYRRWELCALDIQGSLDDIKQTLNAMRLHPDLSHFLWNYGCSTNNLVWRCSSAHSVLSQLKLEELNVIFWHAL